MGVGASLRSASGVELSVLYGHRAGDMAGDSLGFALEALLAHGIPRQFLWQDFDRNRAVQTSVPGTIHFTHSACAQQCQNLVGARAFHQR